MAQRILFALAGAGAGAALGMVIAAVTDVTWAANTCGITGAVLAIAIGERRRYRLPSLDGGTKPFIRKYVTRFP